MLYMVIEHFRNGDAAPVYRRFREQGRLAPEGLRYVSSWVTRDLKRCYQVMEADDPALLREWISRWEDLGATRGSSEAEIFCRARLASLRGASGDRSMIAEISSNGS